MKFLMTLICSVAVIGCSSQDEHTTISTEKCIAAFLWIDNHVKGTELQSHPQTAELQIRVMYEQAKAVKRDDATKVEQRVLRIGREFDQDTATKVAKGCMIEQEMGDDYRKQRPRLIAMRRALDERRAAKTNTDQPH